MNKTVISSFLSEDKKESLDIKIANSKLKSVVVSLCKNSNLQYNDKGDFSEVGKKVSEMFSSFRISGQITDIGLSLRFWSLNKFGVNKDILSNLEISFDEKGIVRHIILPKTIFKSLDDFKSVNSFLNKFDVILENYLSSVLSVLTK